MNDSFIYRQMKRCNRNLLLTNLIMLGILLIIAASSYNYYYNFLFGPFPMGAGSIEAITNPETLKKSYITVRGNDIEDTGLQYITTTYEEGTNRLIATRVESEYYYLFLQDKLLVVKSPPGEATTLSHSGKLVGMSGELRIALIQQLEDVSPLEFNAVVLPLVLDTQINKVPGWIGLSILIPLFFFTVWSLAKFATRSADPLRHPIYAGLGSYGEADQVAEEIEKEIQSSGLTKVQRLFFANNWLLKISPFGLKIIPIQDVLWVYKKVTKQRVNFIPVGKTYSLIIHLRNRKLLTLGMSQKNVEEALEAFRTRAPQVINGYSDELAYLWNKNFSEFLTTAQP